MPRKVTKALVREAAPDRIYGNQQVTRVINRVMRDGKKQTAERLVYQGMEIAAKKVKNDNPLEVFEKAMANIKPHMETRSRRVGGSVYQIPREVGEARGRSLTLRWIIEAASQRSDKSMGLRIGSELLDAYEERGGAFKKKLDVHKMAEANKAFAHYRW